MKKLAVLAAATALALPAAANAQATVTKGATFSIINDNNFKSDLFTSFGLTNYTTSGASIVLNPGNYFIQFDLLGSESGFSDTFDAKSVHYTEMTNLIPWGITPLGGDAFSGGSLAGLLNFSSVTGTSTVGSSGFGIFLTAAQAAGAPSFGTSVLYLGYDDQITNPDDDNHDDLMIRATITAVPEPSTWGLMILGFGALGMAMRGSRRREGSAIGKIKFA